jgi:hypothetical protein
MYIIQLTGHVPSGSKFHRYEGIIEIIARRGRVSWVEY